MKNPRHFEIQVENGHHPLSYVCTTMHEAYGCMEDLCSMSRKFADRINLDTIMISLVEMCKGETLRHEATGYYSISIKEGEV